MRGLVDLTETGRTLGGPRKRDEWESKEEYLLFLRHFKAYDFAKKYVKDRSVLEIGCGSGYGANLLSRIAERVVAIDISEQAISYCKNKYKHGKGDLIFKGVERDWVRRELPFAESSFDVCVSFQVIEHIHPKDVNNFLCEIERVVRSCALLSTPNAKLRLLPFQKPWNPEHFKEYDYTDFYKILAEVFSGVEIYGLYGAKDIQAIEQKRVKQNPISVYFRRPVKSVIKKIAPRPLEYMLKLIHPLRGARNLKEKDTSFIKLYSVQDYKLIKMINMNSNFITHPLDLIATCR